MNTETVMSLEEQRLALRLRLSLQRQRLRHLLTPASSAADTFPRSMTMRLITRRPAATFRLISQVALLLLGPRLVRGLGGALLISKLLYSAMRNQEKSQVANDRASHDSSI